MRALQIFAGLVLLCIGLLLFGYTSGFLLATTNDLFGIALILSGVLFWIPGLVWRKPLPWLTALFIPGTLAFAIGAIMLYIGQAGSAAWVYLMPIPIIVIGFAFLSMYVLGPRVHWLRFVGAIITLIALALFALVLTVSTEFAARIIGPVVLIGLGLLIAVRPLVTRSKLFKEESMEESQRALNRRFETICWGAFFIWWGLTTLFAFLPEGVGTVGIGLILIGLNLMRYFNQIPTSMFTITIGVIAVALGGLEIMRSVLRLPFEMPTLPIVLIALGVIVLVREMTRAK